jgi:DNA polymerase I-like protein with 3'-5' exonuclease and polymerase domains
VELHVAITYGGNGSTIAKNCNISASDGDFVYNTYFEVFPEMKNYFDLGFQKATYYGYIEFNPITKRKYFFNQNKYPYFVHKDEVESDDFWRVTYNAREIFKKYSSSLNEVQRLSQNYPIQGTAGDITKYAGILFFKEILRRNWWLKVKIVNVIHDEYLVECPFDISNEVKDVLINCMEEAGKPFCKTVELKASAELGDYWVH